jgi:hypothetical protein
MSEESKSADFSTLVVHPLPCLAGILILFNAIYLRPHHAGFWSGKLSDVGICFLLPVLLAASWMLFAKVIHWLIPERHLTRPRPIALLSCLVAGGYFSALNLIPGFPHFHETMMSFVVEAPIKPTMDVTDLFCLVFTVGAYFFIYRKISER